MRDKMKTDMVTKNDNSPNRKSEQRRYHAPRLLMFGSIQSLTAGGTGADLESVAGNMSSNNQRD